mmetsp:Transcript_121029/g.314322  ORF Transcript_121029/g.314322 Transcript_121029/m.314322 type:complete len:540 (+) Transcript_121029:73-1692(+)
MFFGGGGAAGGTVVGGAGGGMYVGGAGAAAGGMAAAGGADGGCAGSCGGAEALCFQAEGSVSRTQWRFVGVGRGGYEQMQNYNYVGEGCGSYVAEEVSVPYGWRVRPVCMALLAVIVVAAVAVFLMQPAETTTTTAVTTVSPIDCSSSVGLTEEKQSFCCRSRGLYCPTTQPPTPPPTPPPTAPPPPPPPPTPPTMPPTPPPTPPPMRPAALPFDCNAGFSNWAAGWSAPKKAWCCAHGGKGCAPPPTASLPFDCMAGFNNWKAGWSMPKKVWCCAHQSKGCEAAQKPAPAPSSSCLIWGDPHINTFDHSYANFYGEGIKWLVKTGEVHIQARYKATPFTNGLAATNAVAVGGAFLQGHVLKVGPMENGQITWDNEPILDKFGTFNAAGLGTITYNDKGELVDAAQSHLQRHIVHMALPSNVQVQIMRWSNHINLRITMPPLPGIDGHCGNFNQNPGDDTTEQIRDRIGLSVPQGESLFKTYQAAKKGQRKTVNECEAPKRAKAEEDCKKAFPGIAGMKLTDCTFDACFAGKQYLNEGY